MLIDLLDFHSRKYNSKFVLGYFNLEPSKLMMLRFLRSHIFMYRLNIKNRKYYFQNTSSQETGLRNYYHLIMKSQKTNIKRLFQILFGIIQK